MPFDLGSEIELRVRAAREKAPPPAEALFARKAMGRGVAALRMSGHGRYGMMELAPSTITDWPE